MLCPTQARWPGVDPLVAVQSSGGALTARAGKLDPAALEKRWQLSKAQGGQKWGALALGVANLVCRSVVALGCGALLTHFRLTDAHGSEAGLCISQAGS